VRVYYNPNLKELATDLRNHQTHAEKALWFVLKGKSVFNYDFHRQKPFGNFIYDFYCNKLKLVIEVDGISHEDEDVKRNDRDKDEYAKDNSFQILRFTDDEVLGNIEKVIEIIKAYINDFEKC